MEALYQIRKPPKSVRIVIEAIGHLFRIEPVPSTKHRVPASSNYTPSITRLVEDYEGSLRSLQNIDVTTLGNDVVDLLIENVAQKEFNVDLSHIEGGEEVATLCAFVLDLMDRIYSSPGRKPIGKRRIMVAMDGSRMSYAAFEIASQLRGHNLLQVVHITDPTKDYLPPHLEPQYLLTDFEARCVRKAIPSSSFSVAVRAKEQDQSTRDALQQAAWNFKSDILILGSFGRKGPSIFQMGSVTDWSVRTIPVTTVIVRPESVVPDDTPIVGGGPPPVRPSLFMCAVDGSDVAADAMEMALFLMKPVDRLLVLHIRIADGTQGRSEDVVARYESRLANAMVDGRVVLEEKLGGKTISQQICQAVAREEASFLVMGVDGMGAFNSGKRIFGSVSDACAERARCTVVLVKKSLSDAMTEFKDEHVTLGNVNERVLQS